MGSNRVYSPIRGFALALAALVAAGCFDPTIKTGLTCGPGGECPAGQRCETTSSVCVAEDTPPVTRLHFARVPSAAEAEVAVPEVVVELMDGTGRIVDVSGARATLALVDDHYGTVMTGDSSVISVHGAATFASLVFDRPARHVRLVARVGTFTVESEAFDVSPARPVVSSIVPPASVEGCASIQYQLAQAQGLPVDVAVEVDPDGADGPAGFVRAHQGPSPSGQQGVDHVPARATGGKVRFSWNSSMDVPGVDADALLRVTASVGGRAGAAVTSSPVAVRNGMRWLRHDVDEPGLSLLHVADFDSDGFPDVITAAGTKLVVHYGNRDAHLDVDVGTEVRELAAADLNRDGMVDLAVATNGGLRIFYQQRGGQPTGPTPQLAGPASVAQVLTGDIDHDGLVDLVVVDGASGDVSIYRNSLASGFSLWATPWTEGAVGRLVLSDRNVVELDIGRPVGAVMAVDVVHGAPSTPRPWQGLSGAEIAAADLDADGWTDVAALASDGLRIGFGGSNVTAGPFTDIRGTHLVLADMNLDGHVDAVVADGQTVKVFLRTGAGREVGFAPGIVVAEESGVVAVGVADVDVDGRVDVVTANAAAAHFSTFVADTPRPCGSRLGGPRGVAPGFAIRGLADVDSDGKLDLVGTGAVFASGLGDGTFAQVADHNSLPPSAASPGAQIIDLDGDGASDVVGLSGTLEGSIELVFDNPLQPLSYPAKTQVPTIASPEALAIGDVDGDGRLDLVVAGPGQIQVVLADARQGRAFVVLPPFATALAACGAGDECLLELVDLDADGHPELVAQRGAELTVFPADPAAAGRFLAPVVTDVGDGRVLAIGNVVGDAKPELLMRSSLDGTESPAALVAYGWIGGGLDVVWWAHPGGKVMGAALAPWHAGEPTKAAVQLREAVTVFSPDQVPDGANVPRDRDVYTGVDTELDTHPAFVDLDADGLDDLFVGDAWVVRGRPDGGFDGGSLVAPLGLTSGRVAFGHLSGDPRLEALEVTDEVTHFWLCDSFSGCRAESGTGVPGIGVYSLQDVDFDHRDDLLYGASSTGGLALDVSTGADGFAFSSTCTTTASPLALGDLDEDGVSDMVVVDHDVVEWISDPSTTCSVPQPLYSVMEGESFATPVFAAVVDMNRDGRLDVVTVGTAVKIALRIPGAPGTFSPVQTYEIQDQFQREVARGAAVADLNRDGRPDLAVALSSWGLLVLENTIGSSGDLFWRTETSIPNTPMALGDIDHNGWMDVIAGGAVYLRSGPFPGSFDHAYDTLPSREVYLPRHILGHGTLIDFDADGDLDYLVADPYHGLLEVEGE